MSYLFGDSVIKIAVAEDHTSYREALCKMINDWENCKVILQTASGKQLIEEMNPKNIPDVALIDLRMPEMNGYETIQYLKNKYPQIKFLVISMFESEDAIALMIKSGAEGFINKSSDLKQIQKAIYEVVRTGYYFSDPTSVKLFRDFLKKGNESFKNALTEEEIFFLQLNCSEKSYKEIADKMSTTERHVEYIRNNLFERFGVQSRTGLAIHSIESGLSV